MLLDRWKLVWKSACFVVLLVCFPETNGSFLFLNAIKHLHILPLYFFYLLFPVCCIQRWDVILGTPSSTLRGFLSVVILSDFLEKQSILSLNFRVLCLQHVVFLGIVIQQIFITDGIVPFILFSTQLFHFSAMIAHAHGDLIVSQSVLIHRHLRQPFRTHAIDNFIGYKGVKCIAIMRSKIYYLGFILFS